MDDPTNGAASDAANGAASRAANDDAGFLGGLVKAARQKPHRVEWTDRDGTARTTVLSPQEATRLNEIAQAKKISKAELLRQAAHVPVRR